MAPSNVLFCPQLWDIQFTDIEEETRNQKITYFLKAFELELKWVKTKTKYLLFIYAYLLLKY